LHLAVAGPGRNGGEVTSCPWTTELTSVASWPPAAPSSIAAAAACRPSRSGAPPVPCSH